MFWGERELYLMDVNIWGISKEIVNPILNVFGWQKKIYFSSFLQAWRQLYLKQLPHERTKLPLQMLALLNWLFCKATTKAYICVYSIEYERDSFDKTPDLPVFENMRIVIIEEVFSWISTDFCQWIGRYINVTYSTAPVCVVTRN